MAFDRLALGNLSPGMSDVLRDLDKQLASVLEKLEAIDSDTALDHRTDPSVLASYDQVRAALHDLKRVVRKRLANEHDD
jgi:hypothetical protein